MPCVRCHAQIPDGNRFCDACGLSIELVCEACGHSHRSGARFCAGCGRALAGRDSVPLMPPRLATQVLESRFAREGERKLVTVLFADIRGSTELIQGLDPEQALQRLDPVLLAMTQAVHRFGGTVNRVHGDGIMALFGAPQAHEDHAVRACLAARAMLDVVAGTAERAIEIRVGLHSGEVVVRSIGNDMSMEYEAVGPTAHLASRVEQLAKPGTAALTAETARLADGFIVTRSLGPSAIKGISAPRELFELAGIVGRNRWEARAAAYGLSRFVGRTSELGALIGGLTRARARQGTVIEIVGEAGLGKSRLIHELTNHAVGAGFAIFSAAAMPYDRDTPYFVISGLLRALLQISVQDSLADIDRKLVAGVGPLCETSEGVLSALRALLDVPVDDAEWERLDAPQRRQRTHEALRSMLVWVGVRTPLVLILEDLHWADAESLAVLKVVIDSIRVSHLLIVAASRPEFESGWRGCGYASLLQLAPLDTGDADALLGSLLGEEPELASVRNRLIERTGREPLFLEEMAHALVDTGVLERVSNGLRLTRSHEEIDVPSSLQAVIASRIDRLPVTSRAVLQVASVVGKDVAIGPLRAVAELPDAQLFAQLAILQSLEFLHEVSQPAHLQYNPSHLQYSFKHALTHSVTYEGMLLKHRRALHSRVMSAIELLHADRLEEFTERLAQHAARSEDYAKAVDYNYKAGLRANARSAYREATLFLERALDALGHLPATPANADRSIDIRLGLRVALLASGDLLQVRLHLEEAESRARALGDRQRLMPIVISRATISYNLGALDDSIEAGLQGRLLAEQADDTGCYVSACFALGQAYWNRGDFKASVSELSRGIDRVGRGRQRQFNATTGSVSVLCRVSLSHTFSFMGETGQACTTAQEALEIAHEMARPYDLSYAHAAQGLATLTLGNLTDAILQLEKALQLSEAADIRLLFPHAVRYLGRAYALTGRLDEARTLLERAVDYASRHSLVPLHGWCAASLGLTHLMSGELTAARTAASIAHDLAERHGYVPLRAHAARLTGAVIGWQGDRGAVEEAERWFRQGATVAREIGMQPEVAHCHRDLAGLLARSGRSADARADLTTAIQIFHSCGMSYYAAESEQDLLALPASRRSTSTYRSAVREHDATEL